MPTLLLIHGGLWEDIGAGELLRLLPSAAELPGCPEAPRPEFPPYLESFLAAVAGFAGSAG